MIACIHIPNFVTTLERKVHRLPADQPMIVRTTAAKGSFVMAACPYAAREGVTVGMTLRYAQMLSPDARIVPANPTRYRLTRDAVLDLLWLFADRIETMSSRMPNSVKPSRKTTTALPDPHLICYLDFGTLKQTDVQTLVAQLHDLLHSQQGLDATVGVAYHKFTAYVAALHSRTGQTMVVPQRQEAGFLASHPITRLSIQPDMARRLHLLGIETLGQFAALPPGAVLAQFGKTGRTLHRLARGLDDTPVIATPKRVEHTASRSFDDPVADIQRVSLALGQLAVQLVRPLIASGLACRELRLSLSLANGSSYETLFVLRRPTQSADHLHQTAFELFQRAVVVQGVMGIEFTITDLVVGEMRQLDLFSESHSEHGQPRVLQDVAARYGDCLFRAVASDPTARLAEARFSLQSARLA